MTDNQMNKDIEQIVSRVIAELQAISPKDYPEIDLATVAKMSDLETEPNEVTSSDSTNSSNNVCSADSKDQLAAIRAKTETQKLHIDLVDPTIDEERHKIMVKNPADPAALRNLCASSGARLGVGNAGPRPLTRTALLFFADHGTTQDAIYGTVDQKVVDKLKLFKVKSKAKDRAEYLLHPELGRLLDDDARKLIEEKCIKKPDVQICVGDGLSAAAIDNNLEDIYPAILQGLDAAGFKLGTPFLVENARVGIMNDINSIIHAKVIILLIGERPGLGIADALSSYMGFDPQPGKTDADRDLLCMITTNGGTNPLEAGAYISEFIKRMIKYSASGVKLRDLATAAGEVM